MTIVDFTIVNVSLPTIGRDLHLTATGLQWVVTAYALTLGGFLLLGGRAADLLGRRRILMLGLALFTTASLACGLARSDAFLIAGRAVQGLGGAIMLPAALSIVMNMFEEGAERNKALGIWGGLGAAAGTVGLIAGGVLTRYAGWQSIFYLNVPIGAVALALAPRLVPDSRLATTRRRFDVLGATVGTGGLVLLVDAISQAPQYGWGATQDDRAACRILGAADRRSWRSRTGLMLRCCRCRSSGCARSQARTSPALLLGGSFFAFVFVGTMYMQEVLHYSALQTGAAWLAASVTSMSLAGLSQWLVTRIRRQGRDDDRDDADRRRASFGRPSCPSTGISWRTSSARSSSPVPGRRSRSSRSRSPRSTGVEEHKAGLASGLLNTSQQFGGAIGVAIASSVATEPHQALSMPATPRERRSPAATSRRSGCSARSR